MKIDGPPRKREATLESVAWQATLRLSLRAGFLEKREKWRIPSYFARCQKNKPALYFAVKVAHPPQRKKDIVT
jgi:hypothetical protein